MARPKKSASDKNTTVKSVEKEIEKQAECATEETLRELPQRVEDAELKALKTEEEPKLKSYKDSDTITCRSITMGLMAFTGKKSGNYYVFSNYDDTCEIEVGDLNSFRATKSGFLFNPLFVIEDEDFLSQPKWAEIKELYNSIISSDVDEILSLSVSEFKAALKQLPKGYKDALCSKVSTLIQDEEFDSLQKIKAIDEICDTDLACLIK